MIRNVFRIRCKSFFYALPPLFTFCKEKFERLLTIFLRLFLNLQKDENIKVIYITNNQLINHLTTKLMKKMKQMALAVLLMPLLFACSGGSSTDTNLYGSLPEKYEKFMQEKADLKKQAENIKTEADKKELIEKSEKMQAEWKVKIEECAKTLNGKPIEVEKCDFTITTPLSLEFTDFYSNSNLTPSFKINGEATATSDMKTGNDFILPSENVYLVGYNAEGQEVYKTLVGNIAAENVDGKTFVKAGTPVEFDNVKFSKSDIKNGCKDAKTYKLELKRL